MLVLARLSKIFLISDFDLRSVAYGSGAGGCVDSWHHTCTVLMHSIGMHAFTLSYIVI